MVLRWYQKQNGSQGIANSYHSYYAVVATHQWAQQPGSHRAGSISLWLALVHKSYGPNPSPALNSVSGFALPACYSAYEVPQNLAL